VLAADEHPAILEGKFDHNKVVVLSFASEMGRSLSQVCEALLAGGLDVYKKEGPKYLQRLLSHQKRDSSE
jgi:hypothetical protein